MNYVKLFTLLAFLLNAQFVVAMEKQSGNAAPTLTTEFAKKGTVDDVDSKGKWVRISSKKYVLDGTGSIKLEELRSGLRVYFNVEKEKGEKNGRVTRMWKSINTK